MKKILTLIATGALFFSIGGAARAAASQAEIAPQRVSFSFADDIGDEVKKDGQGKPRPYPTPKPRRPGPRDEGDGDS